nr:l-lactate dehydrogenase [Quercus suber]
MKREDQISTQMMTRSKAPLRGLKEGEERAKANELVLVDAKADKLRDELLDLQHAAAFLPRTKLRDDHLDVNAQDVQLEPSQTVIDPNFENQIGGDLRNLESMEAIGGVVLEADGYQPYLISPEKGGGGGRDFSAASTFTNSNRP